MAEYTGTCTPCCGEEECAVECADFIADIDANCDGQFETFTDLDNDCNIVVDALGNKTTCCDCHAPDTALKGESRPTIRLYECAACGGCGSCGLTIGDFVNAGYVGCCNIADGLWEVTGACVEEPIGCEGSVEITLVGCG